MINMMTRTMIMIEVNDNDDDDWDDWNKKMVETDPTILMTN